ncbi:MAG: glycosyltransferase family 4 protein [Reyranella sp.]|uniref:glycosyltransferase family 4 protein n=1 Tax=Reyranella sp. TaxID=1929291 RepID=UPI001AC41F2E|nr:glycosyltransferase family 4 protein [Reyranella sp.]MBN9088927.1 glycosyltransferase family 4 protein [Reyranella sp.]
MSLRLGFLVSHPIQYYAPIFRALAERCDLSVFFAHRQTGEGQAKAGFGIAFDWDVDLLAGYRSTFLTNVARQPSTDRFSGCDTPGIAQEIARGRFDAFVVPGWGLRTYLQAVRACRRARVPVMVRGDSQLPGQRSTAVRLAKALFYRRMMRRFDGYLYVGQRSRAYFEHYGAPMSRLFFAPHCIDNQAFTHDRPARRTPDGRRRLLFAGKLIERKRPLDLVRAAALLQGRGAKVEVAFAGSGELEAELKRATEAAGLPAVFHGFVNQSALPATYAAADLLALPSDARETWGLVVNEGMACGLPAVVSDAVGCGPDLIEEGATGAVFPLGDIEGLAGALARTLALDPARSGEAIRARLAVYSPRRTAQGIMDAATALRRLAGNETGL